MPNISKNLNKELIAHGKFVGFSKISWQAPDGKVRSWEAVDRQIQRDAVLVIAKLVPSQRIVFIKQFRPPASADVIEFPAGLLELQEKVEEGALRELREETGYIGNIINIFPKAFTSPGLSSETIYLIEATIDENTVENLNPVTEFDESEFIDVILVPVEELLSFYQSEVAKGTLFDAKVVSFILAKNFS